VRIRIDAIHFLFVVFFVVVMCPLLASGTTPEDREACFKGSGNQAVEACEQVLVSSPDDIELHLRLGDLLLTLKRYKEASATLKRAQNLFPDNQKIKHKLEMADSLQKEHQWLGKQSYGKPDNIVISSQKGQMELDRIRCTRLKGARGLSSCEEALKMMPNDPTLHHSRGNILLEMGLVDEAKEAFMSALKLDPTNKEYTLKVAALNGIVAEGRAKKSGNQTKGVGDTKISNPSPESTQPEVIKRLSLLKSLLDQELIDEEEFNRRKKRLMDTVFASGQGQKDKAEAKAVRPEYFGDYYALVIGIQNYKHLTPLQTVRKDVADIASVLKKDYGFQVETLLNASRRQILLSLGKYRRELSKKDNLLIYYAGHGWLDEDADAGYWLPVDALQDNDVDWLSLTSVTAVVRAIPAKHIMIVADSCYSGKLTRGVHIRQKGANYLDRLVNKKARVVMTSGGLEPVLDSGGAGGHSVFAAAFLKVLKENHDIIDSTTLFTRIRRPVMLTATQTPEYADIRKAGHEGGDFIFVRTIK
jgi:tetratricopeptide (TPR) repeat protein